MSDSPTAAAAATSGSTMLETAGTEGAAAATAAAAAAAALQRDMARVLQDRPAIRALNVPCCDRCCLSNAILLDGAWLEDTYAPMVERSAAIRAAATARISEVRDVAEATGDADGVECPCTDPRSPRSSRLQLPIIGIPSVPPTAGFGEISAYLAKAMDEDDAFLCVWRRLLCPKGTRACVGVTLAGLDAHQHRTASDEAAAAKRGAGERGSTAGAATPREWRWQRDQSRSSRLCASADAVS